MSIFTRIFHSRDKPRNSLLGSTYSFFFGSSASGKAVNPLHIPGTLGHGIQKHWARVSRNIGPEEESRNIGPPFQKSW